MLHKEIEKILSRFLDETVTQLKLPNGETKNVAPVMVTAAALITMAKAMNLSIDGRELNQALFLSQYLSIAMGTGYIFTDDFELWKFGPAQRKVYARFACGTFDVCTLNHDLSDAKLMPAEYLPAMMKALMTIKMNCTFDIARAVLRIVPNADTGLEKLNYEQIEKIAKRYEGEIPGITNIVM